ncbi:MAG: indolepyruvate ferredoxin oxidoreductase subunit alpha [Planctomycetaceae bacterium]|nr:indolepyruvate ferredoxin oxidoreductase subunit alpha [Planctomycetaceae bacterium]
MQELMSGNEAIARGAWEAGVTVASGYPGTPSTEILENTVKYKDDLYCEWAPNEKVAFEVAAGASLAGARSFCTMKHVGLNVAADPLMTLAYVGVVGGFVAVVADDPGMHSSQNEQDTRQYARFAKIPILEPSDAQEAKDYMKRAFEISEQFNTPVILRSTTRISHARSLVELTDRKKVERTPFEKNPPRFVPIPAWGRKMRIKVEERLHEMRAASEMSDLNRIEMGNDEFGIITSSIAYQYVKEVFPDASVLKLGWTFPFPDSLIREFAAKVNRLLIVEELDEFIEEHVRSLGITCEGRNLVPGIGELSPDRVETVRERVVGRDNTLVGIGSLETSDLPARPPVLCAGCPHRGVFTALGKFKDVIVCGDIGCYSLGVMPPLSRLDTILCMGGGISVAHGMAKAGEEKKIVGMVGDSTFFHSGITGLLDIAWNKSNVVITIVDNRTTAMTGHQDHPGTGRTLMGEPAPAASIEKLVEACGISRCRVVDPYDIEGTVAAFREEMDAPEPSVIISHAPCLLAERKTLGKPFEVFVENCKKCGACLRIGCPALETIDKQPFVNPDACVGCGICKQMCKFNAIARDELERERALT